MRYLVTVNDDITNKALSLIQAFVQAKRACNIQLVVKITDVAVSIALKTRSLEQNAKLWAMLKDISEQCLHFGVRYSSEDWKDIFTASLNHEIRMTPTVDGRRMVLLGLRTSKMSQKMLGDLIEFIYAYGNEQGVIWRK